MTAWAEEVVREGGYLILAALIALENLFPPIPSELLLPLAGSRVAVGEMGFFGAVLAATIGSLFGAMILYALGRLGGRPLLLKYGRWLRLDEARLDKADEWFDTHGGKIVFFGRLVPGVRSVVSIPAGLSEMPLGKFVLLTTAGSAVWNCALIGAGWALGSRWHEATALVESLDIWFYVGIVAAVALTIGAAMWRRRSLSA